MSVVYSYEAKDKKIRRIIKTFWLNLVLTTKLMSIRVLGIYSSHHNDILLKNHYNNKKNLSAVKVLIYDWILTHTNIDR